MNIDSNCAKMITDILLHHAQLCMKHLMKHMAHKTKMHAAQTHFVELFIYFKKRYKKLFKYNTFLEKMFFSLSYL